jgi:hypothetical protein
MGIERIVINGHAVAYFCHRVLDAHLTHFATQRNTLVSPFHTRQHFCAFLWGFFQKTSDSRFSAKNGSIPVRERRKPIETTEKRGF